MYQICTCAIGIIHRGCPVHGIKPETTMTISPPGLDGFDEFWQKRGYANDCPSDRRLAEDVWKGARGEKYYPCNRCGIWFTAEEGGDLLSVCLDCLILLSEIGVRLKEDAGETLEMQCTKVEDIVS